MKHKCKLCKTENAVWCKHDFCAECQRKIWLVEEQARIDMGGEAIGYVPPQEVSRWVSQREEVAV